MKIKIDKNEYTINEFFDQYSLDMNIQQKGPFKYESFVTDVKFRNMRGEVIRAVGRSPEESINNYIKKIQNKEISITNTKPHTRVVVPKISYIKITDLKKCGFCPEYNSLHLFPTVIKQREGGRGFSWATDHRRWWEYDYGHVPVDLIL